MKNKFAIIIRGASGSGKTTFANRLISIFENKGIKLVHSEADMFRINEKDEYHFDPETVVKCHNNCFEKFKKDLKENNSVIVSNCFVKIEHIKRYIEHLKNNKIKYVVIKMQGEFANLHEVPDETVFEMRKNYESLEEEIVIENQKNISEKEIEKMLKTLL